MARRAVGVHERVPFRVVAHDSGKQVALVRAFGVEMVANRVWDGVCGQRDD